LFSILKNEVYGKEKKKTVVNILAYGDNNDPETLYKKMMRDFNEYSKNKGLNIEVKIDITQQSDTYEAYGSQVEQLLKRRNNKYDFFYFDNAYTQKYGRYLLDLREHLPKEHIDIYDPKILKFACEYDGKLVGLPFTVVYSLLYSNTKLLQKYDRSIPQTWEELIETSLYIKEKENDPNFIAYNGFMGDGENGLFSIYEFIHSCRNSPEDPFPDIRSETTINALNLLKRLKNEISTDEIFKQDGNYAMGLLMQGTALFVKFYTLTYGMLSTVPYTPSILPGIKRGISGSSIAGYNLGIDGSINPDKLEDALLVYQYLTSKESQKKYFLIENVISGISSLYDDEDICAKVNCTIYKSIQPNSRPVSKYYDFIEYTNKIFYDISKYLYGNANIENVLEKIDDLTRFHYVSIYDDEAQSLAYIYFITIALLAIVLISILPLVFVKKFKSFFIYYYKELWVIMTLGMLILLGASISTFGPLTKVKCNMYIVCFIFGYTFITVPILFKYIIDFPKENDFSRWVYDHKYIFYLIFVLLDFLLIFIISIKKLYVHDVLINEGKNYCICKYNSTLGLVLSFVFFTLMIVCLLILSYVEWSRKTYCYDIRINSFSLYASILALSLSFILYYISIENYEVYFIQKNTLNIVVVISCALSLYLLRYLAYIKRDKKDDFDITGSKVNSNVSRSNETVSSNSSSNFVMKLREYHSMSKNMDTCVYEETKRSHSNFSSLEEIN